METEIFRKIKKHGSVYSLVQIRYILPVKMRKKAVISFCVYKWMRAENGSWDLVQNGELIK